MPVRESVSRPFRPTVPHGAPADMSDHTSTQRTPVGATALVFSLWLPFSCAYFMSYALRNINAVLAPELTHDFSLSASELGMLTSVFSLAFSLAQLPGGVMMDRYGARRVNASLLLLAAAGCGLFASGSSLTDLVLGRALFGIGMSMCLMAAIKTFSQWFSIQRLPFATGMLLAVGGVGGMLAGAPVGWALQFVTWRTVFLVSGLMLAGSSIYLFLAVPERRHASSKESLGTLVRGFATIVANKTFWRINLMAATTGAAYQGMQSLWIGPWMRDVAGYDRSQVVTMISWLALATTVGFAGMGMVVNQLMKRGWAPLLLFKLHGALFILLFGSIVLFGGAADWVWLVLFTLGTGGVMMFTIYAQTFPQEWSGRVNTAANVCGFLGTFAVQWGVGVVIDRYPVIDGHYDPQAYRIAMLAMWVLLLAAYLWMLPMKRPEGFKSDHAA